MATKEGEEWKEYNNAVRWMCITAIVVAVITLILFITALPLAYLVGNGISKETFADISKFFSLVIHRNGFLYNRYWIWAKQLFNYSGPFSLSLWIPALPFLVLPIGLIGGMVLNPY